MNEDDIILLRQIGNGDAQALSRLYDRYARLVFSLALRIVGRVDLAEEVTQDVFLRVWEKASQYNPRRGSVKTWLVTIARNRTLDVLRRQKRRPPSWHDIRTPEGEGEWFSEQIVADGPTVEETIQHDWEVQRVRVALAQLAPEKRQVLLLAYFEGLSHQEMAERLGLPLGTVKSRLRAALQALHRALAEKVHRK